MALFKDSESTQAYLKMGLFGFAGSGKTRTATNVAIGLAQLCRERKLAEGDRPIYFLDTETGSDYVKPLFKKAGIALRDAKTRAFSDLVPAVREAEKSGAVLIIDSITHFWAEFTESYARKRNRTRGLEFSDWAYLKAEWRKFTDAYINSACHIIMCGRAGHEFDFFTDDNGKKQLEKTGIKMKAEAETGYEPSILVLMDRETDMDTLTVARTAYVVKDRFDVIDGKKFLNPTFDHFRPHIDLLNLGGVQFGVDTDRTSEGMIPSADYSAQNLSKEREAVLDEIKELLVKHHPSSGAADKKAKGDLLEKHTGTRSWERLSMFGLSDLQIAFRKLFSDLECVDIREPQEETLPGCEEPAAAV